MAFNENTRVKIPALLHLTQLGYEYVSLKSEKAIAESDANIFTNIFIDSITRINPDSDDVDPFALIVEIKALLDYDDLGRAFYNRLLSTTSTKLIDWGDFNNNSFHVCTELTCKNGDDEFRPDITVLVNGIPLVFIEVKKPNNPDGILAERNRINARFQNQKFRRFLNATQFMIFSNNMEYDTETVEQLQGAFYATIGQNMKFNCFTEEKPEIFKLIANLDESTERFILKDNNLAAIKDSPEYITNKSPTKPTNRIITSLLNRDRLALILRYGLVYVDDVNGVSKHIMRYPQLFATLAIEAKINGGIKNGIIWHTQGSGKTALAYFNVAYLTNYYRKKNIVPKFYFIVDRIDLMTQAQTEFENRDLRVKIVNSKDDFVSNIASLGAIDNDSGVNEITVVNIQKFSEDSKVAKQSDYDINVQRIYFLDEVHRSYNPHGSFLANLRASDPNAVYIGLTGTPLLQQKIKSKDGKKTELFDSKHVFGDYIHKYYYNSSIQDGFTLRLIREGIKTEYRNALKDILAQLEVLRGTLKRSELFAKPKYVAALAKFIISDFTESRMRLSDDSIGGMVVCDSSEQAKELFNAISENHPDINSALILHDIDDKETRRKSRDDFKLGNNDLLIVYNMLLTGFDAHRLKKLYLNRVVKDHNLLQTLTRVNRPYKNFRYGYVVDFADIRHEFDKTNAAYFEELQDEIGDEWEKYSNLFKSAEEIECEIAVIREKLFIYDIQNAEVFSEQINEIDDKEIILDIKRALESAKTLGNLIRMFGHDDLAAKLDFNKMNTLLAEVNNRLALINQKESLENGEDNSNIVNMAIENIIFAFRKISEDELQLGIIDVFKEQIRKTREAMQSNFDHVDLVYISLAEELELIFKKKKVTEMTTEDIEGNIILLRSIYDRITEQNRRDALLKSKYHQDEKFTRIHKRIVEAHPDWDSRLVHINQALLAIKYKTDEQILYQHAVLNNEPFFAQSVQPLVIANFGNNALKLDATAARQINNLIVAEYMKEHRGSAFK